MTQAPEAQAIIGAAPSVAVGFNIATVTINNATPLPAGYLVYGTATGVYTSAPIGYQPCKRVVAADGTVSYQLVFVITGIQLAAAQTYFAQVVYVGGSTSSEATWSQPGLNANAADLVHIQNKAKKQLARIADIAQKGARQGWLSNTDWVGLNRAKLAVQEYNRIKWNDGR
jgi:hypothetical protein